MAGRGEHIMLWSTQNPLPGPVLETLRKLDGNNPDCHPVIWGCCTRGCHAHGIFLCPQVNCLALSLVSGLHASAGGLPPVWLALAASTD